MEDTLIFVDDGFFGLVKKHLQKKNPLILEVLENHVLLKGKEIFIEEMLE